MPQNFQGRVGSAHMGFILTELHQHETHMHRAMLRKLQRALTKLLFVSKLEGMPRQFEVGDGLMESSWDDQIEQEKKADL